MTMSSQACSVPMVPYYSPWHPCPKDDEPASILYLPPEMTDKIARHLDIASLGNLRLVNRQLSGATRNAFLDHMISTITIFPKYESLSFFSSLISVNDELPLRVSEITLVGESFKTFANVYEWERAWEALADEEDVTFSSKDMHIITDTTMKHAVEAELSTSFIACGLYRTMLKKFLRRLPNLRQITVRKIRPGEHLPGWEGPEALQKLSCYHEDLDTSPILYGDYMYDSTHGRVTLEIDEFGDLEAEVGITPGPQETFWDDLASALGSSKLPNRASIVVEVEEIEEESEEEEESDGEEE